MKGFKVNLPIGILLSGLFGGFVALATQIKITSPSEAKTTATAPIQTPSAEISAMPAGPVPVKIAWVGLSRPWTLQLVESYLVSPNSRPLTIAPLPAAAPPGEVEKSPFDGRDVPMDHVARRFRFAPLTKTERKLIAVTNVPMSTTGGLNPLPVANKDFAVGDLLPWPLETPAGPPPAPDAQSLDWFHEQVSTGQSPDVFIVAGHHVISEGFHNNEETKFLFEPSLFQTVARDPDARAYFDHVKIAILWGCNSLTDLEPHHDDGSVMDQAEIRDLYESGPTGRRQVLGTEARINSMEFYKARLAREYGIHSPEPSYVRVPEQEKCDIPLKYVNCELANLERILPNPGLYDGSRRFNEALKMNELFRNAYLVLGFSSASPAEELRVLILQEAADAARATLGLNDQSVFQVILNPQTEPSTRARAIVALREAWEKTSYRMNRGRPSGSITPALPEIDQGYVMSLRQTKQPQLNAKFR